MSGSEGQRPFSFLAYELAYVGPPVVIKPEPVISPEELGVIALGLEVLDEEFNPLPARISTEVGSGPKNGLWRMGGRVFLGFYCSETPL
ncbi:MAG: hypothetical protein ABIM19_00675 [candidate division WOR-3 bacterium]